MDHDARLVPVGELKLYGKNPRRGDVAAIQESLRANGQYRPLVVRRKTSEVLAGNHTLEAAIAEGWSEVWVTFIDVTPAQAKRIVLVDNRSNDLAAYDDQALLDLIGELPDLKGTGYDEDAVRALAASVLPDAEPPSDDAPEPPEEPKTKPGDLYRLGEHRVLCGDATEPSVAERIMDSDRAPLLFTSPPYADVRDYGGESDLTVEYLTRFVGVWAGFAGLQAVNLGILRREGAVLRYWDEYIAAAEGAGLKLLSWNVWNREIPYSMAQQTAMFPIEHEWVLVFGKAPRDLRLTVENRWGGRRTDPGNRQRDGSVTLRDNVEIRSHRPLGTVYTGPPHLGASDGGHPATFPISFPQAYIEAATEPGEWVIDPFGGAGATLMAAEHAGRRAALVEINPAYVDVIVRRWEDHTGRKAERVEA